MSTEHRQDLSVRLLAPCTCVVCQTTYRIASAIVEDAAHPEHVGDRLQAAHKAAKKAAGWVGDTCPACSIARGLTGRGPRLSAAQRLDLRGRLAQRAAKVYLEALNLFRSWQAKSTEENLSRYVRALRRCQRLQAADRRLA